MKSNTILSFLLGAVLVLSGAVTTLVLSPNATPAYADAAGRGDLFAVVGVGYTGQSRDVLFVLDSSSRRLAIYEMRGTRFALTAVRNIEYDLKFEEFGKQAPPVKKMRSDAQRAEKKK